jgi:hypothetical protein
LKYKVLFNERNSGIRKGHSFHPNHDGAFSKVYFSEWPFGCFSRHLCPDWLRHCLLSYPISPTDYGLWAGVHSTALGSLKIDAYWYSGFGGIVGHWVLAQLSKSQAALNTSVWNETSKRLVINLMIPLVTGGIFILILLYNNHYGVVAPACLIFYGLALIQASGNLYEEVRYLGYSEIALGTHRCSASGVRTSILGDRVWRTPYFLRYAHVPQV